MYGYNPEVNSREERLSDDLHQSRLENPNHFRYLEAFRRHGYKYANLNPVSTEEPSLGCELDMTRYGLTSTTERERLSDLYCGPTGLDCGYLESEAEQEWLYAQYEAIKQVQLEVRPNVEQIRRCFISLNEAKRGLSVKKKCEINAKWSLFSEHSEEIPCAGNVKITII